MERTTKTRTWNNWTRRVTVGTVAAGIALLSLMATRTAGQDRALTYSVLYTFCRQYPAADGAGPSAGLIRDSAGNLYGTTAGGGAHGYGAIFKLDPMRNETVLYSFTGGADGATPYAGLIRDSAGNLYGTTSVGGNTSSSCFQGRVGCGVVFKLDPLGNETVLHVFTGGADGAQPYAGLIADASGNIYGTTTVGGNTSSCLQGCGVVFKLDPLGNETVLYSFKGGSGGGQPTAGLVRDSAGNLHGTTLLGGNRTSCNGPSHAGCGVIFKLDPLGNETVLYTFKGGADGDLPQAVLLPSQGVSYGTTSFGGDTSGFCYPYGGGVVFEISH